MQLSLQLDSRVWRRKQSCGFVPVQSFRPPSFHRGRRSLQYRAGCTQTGLTPTGPSFEFEMTTDMLKFLTKKLKSQSLNEGNANYHPEVRYLVSLRKHLLDLVFLSLSFSIRDKQRFSSC